MNMILFDSLPQEKSGVYQIHRKDPRAEHILRILRLKPGDTFSMGVVNGPSGEASLLSYDIDTLQFSWIPEHPPAVLHPAILLVGCVRPICMRRILREAASFGVGEIWVCGTDLGEKSYLEAELWKKKRYRSFLIDGAQQAAQTAVPELRMFHCVRSALEEAGTLGGTQIVLDNTEGAQRFSREGPADAPAVLAVGSERGWSDRERGLFRESRWKPLRIGERTLRTETSCSAGLALLLAHMGRI